MLPSYYAERLSGERLRSCYDLATPRVRQYLRAEIDHVRARLSPAADLLELGCGYGRVLFELAGDAGTLTGVDTAARSLALARRNTPPGVTCRFVEMDAAALEFRDGGFDVVICLQNGISAFGVDREQLVREALRVCRPGGRVIFSSYARGFWEHRLEWFERQAAAGLLGPIDREATREGTIVCKDGFRAGYMRPGDFRQIWQGLGLEPEITEVDGSSTFCESEVR